MGTGRRRDQGMGVIEIHEHERPYTGNEKKTMSYRSMDDCTTEAELLHAENSKQRKAPDLR